MTDWRTGTGYPGLESSFAVWEAEFARRAASYGIPYFQREDGLREALSGPVLLQVEEDGTVRADGLLPPQRHLAMMFLLDKPIEAQVERAKRILLGHQRARFAQIKSRARVDKFGEYLRVLDAEAAGADLVEIGKVLWPKEDDSYPDYRRRKHARDATQAARRLLQRWVYFRNKPSP